LLCSQIELILLKWPPANRDLRFKVILIKIPGKFFRDPEEDNSKIHLEDKRSLKAKASLNKTLSAKGITIMDSKYITKS
jgi:hypothetical protein